LCSEIIHNNTGEAKLVLVAEKQNLFHGSPTGIEHHWFDDKNEFLLLQYITLLNKHVTLPNQA